MEKELTSQVPYFDSKQQLYERLQKMTADKILEEMELILDDVDEHNYSGEVIDIYLSVLEEKDPIDLSKAAEESINNIKHIGE